LQVNGQTPALRSHVEPGLDKPPLVFSWFTRPEHTNTEYRYRLYPVEPEWSPWTRDSQAAYYFVAAGSYQFEVSSRGSSASAAWVAEEPARYQFFLERPLIAHPISKASGGAGIKTPASIDLDNLYG